MGVEHATRILALNASHRGAAGHTQVLLARLAKGARGAGAAFEIVVLSEFRIDRCHACQTCQTPAHYLKCVIHDDVAMVHKKMAEADIIIYATPVYVFGMSGLLKSFLERLHSTGDSNDLRLTANGRLFHRVDRAVCSKPFVTVVCCDNIEAETPANVLHYFRTFSNFMEAPQVGVLVRNAGALAKDGRDPEAEQRLPRLRESYAAFEQAGRELATIGRVRRSTARRASQEIVPIPLFALLKRLPLRAMKARIVAGAREMLSARFAGAASDNGTVGRSELPTS